MNIKEMRFLQRFCGIFWVAIVVFFALLLEYVMIGKEMPSQHTASRWQGENSTQYVQNSVFFSNNSKITKTKVVNDMEKLQNYITQEIGDFESDKSIFAFSGESKLAVKSEHSDLILKLVGVGGDYFFFHPLMLKAGNYLNKADLRNNIAILDEQAAWDLFGSTDIIGKQIEISEKDFIIVGVVEMEESQSFSASDRAGNVFLEFGKANQLSGMNVQCFETVMPEPMTGYPGSLLKRLYSDTESEIITNTNRFSILSIFQKMKEPEKFIKQEKAIAFPYYENAARMLEYKLMGKLSCILIVGLLLLGILVVLIIKLRLIIRKFGSKELVIYGRNYFKKYNERIRQKCESNKRFKSGN